MWFVKIKILWFIAFCCAVQHISAKTHHVDSTTGFNQLVAQAVIQPGDEIIWKDGIYSNIDLDLKGFNGTPNQPVKLRSETPGGVVFTGASRLNIGTDHTVISGFHYRVTSNEQTPKQIISFRSRGNIAASNSRLTEIKIEEAEPGKPILQKSKWVVLYGQFNRVDHCYFVNKRTRDNLMTVYLDESNMPNGAWHRIDHNYFGPRPNGRAAGGSSNGWEIIRIGDSRSSHLSAFCRVEKNLFEGCNGEIEIISNKSRDNSYIANTFLNCEGQLTLRHGAYCVVAGNLFQGNGHAKNEESGVRIIGPGHKVVGNTFIGLSGQGERGAIVISDGVENGAANEYEPVANLEIRSNTIIACRNPIVIGSFSGKVHPSGRVINVAPQSVLISDNYIVGGNPIVTFLSQSKPDVTFENNIAYLTGQDSQKIAGSKVQFSPKEILWQNGAATTTNSGKSLSTGITRDNVGPSW
ncbi:polysaccharide lyase 6 family protein [Rubellicoccus peritrichatus]|uniref:Polysaccharide lyase 6 family protein n=1 Tax=Rubellicoccus peritrichatus TaxID=3080537 RepID=A0AAQ3QTD5_9BACT|nr:polysaccharide lyase 6 family protein [Puniceicoccus sp. CR14]WOO41221.1 polysaccharide lyase 6 family protein [Puniceicoccus sp. CR14]